MDDVGCVLAELFKPAAAIPAVIVPATAATGAATVVASTAVKTAASAGMGLALKKVLRLLSTVHHTPVMLFI